MNDVLKKAKSLGKELFVKRGGLCSFGAVFKEKPRYTNFHGACHYGLNNIHPHPEFVIDALFPKPEVPEEVHREYVKLHMELPAFKDLFYDTDLDKIFKQRYIIFNTNVPRNALSMCLMSLRMSFERPNLVNSWWELVKNGVKKEFAFVYAHFLLVKNKSIQPYTPADHHIGLHIARMGLPHIKNFLNNKPVEHCEIFYDHPGYYNIYKYFGIEKAVDPFYKSCTNQLKNLDKIKERPYLFYKEPNGANDFKVTIKLDKKVVDFLNNLLGE